MPPLDPEMAAPVRQQLEKNDVSVALGNGVAGFDHRPNGAIIVNTKSGAKHTGDIVILAIGVRPETGLAKTAGLDIGERGGTRVDDQMRTSDTHIWGVGDAIETHDVITDQPTVIPSPDPRIVKAVSPQMQSTGARRSSEEFRARPCAVFLA